MMTVHIQQITRHIEDLAIDGGTKPVWVEHMGLQQKIIDPNVVEDNSDLLTTDDITSSIANSPLSKETVPTEEILSIDSVALLLTDQGKTVSDSTPLVKVSTDFDWKANLDFCTNNTLDKTL
eukprot:15221955-Ditylum_brightwellii.AAC.2